MVVSPVTRLTKKGLISLSLHLCLLVSNDPVFESSSDVVNSVMSLSLLIDINSLSELRMTPIRTLDVFLGVLGAESLWEYENTQKGGP